jgi:hypothetical protein
MKFYIRDFWESVHRIKALLKSDKTNGFCALRLMYIYDHISPISSENEKRCKQIYSNSKYIFYGQQRHSEKRAFYEIMWKNMAEPQMKI